MGAWLDARRRALRRWGRPFTLNRIAGGDISVTVSLLGLLSRPTSEVVVDGMAGTDARLEVLNDELETSGYPVPVRPPDEVVAGGVAYTIASADPIYEPGRGEIIGWSLRLRGS
jgi:hypothetical protein